MSFLIEKFKGKYRLLTEYDQSTNDFPRKLNGTLEDIDVYIDCSNGIKIFYYGKGILEAYIPSLGRGRNIVKNIYSDFIINIESSEYYSGTEREKDGEIIKTNNYDYASLYIDKDLNKIIWDIIETDEEVIFKFHWTKMNEIDKYFKPKTSAASRSPFSVKNLPKTKYIIPENDLNIYKKIVDNIPKEKYVLIGQITKKYLQSLITKKNTYKDIKSDMKLKGLSGKDYIHFIGMWDEYINYLEKNICL